MKKLLIIILFFVAVSAVGGGLSLVFGKTDIPLSELSGFSSFLIPGLVLTLVVGGTNAIAGIAVLRKSKRAVEWSATAGFSLMIWFFVELYLVSGHNFLQVIYFSLGILLLILTFVAERYKSPNK